MELRSQAVRKLAPENDPLKIGMGWKVDDLAKPQIMVESTFGDSHPGSALLLFIPRKINQLKTWCRYHHRCLPMPRLQDQPLS